MRRIDLKINYTSKIFMNSENTTDTNSNSESIVNNCNNKIEMVQDSVE